MIESLRTTLSYSRYKGIITIFALCFFMVLDLRLRKDGLS